MAYVDILDKYETSRMWLTNTRKCEGKGSILLGHNPQFANLKRRHSSIHFHLVWICSLEIFWYILNYFYWIFSIFIFVLQFHKIKFQFLPDSFHRGNFVPPFFLSPRFPSPAFSSFSNQIFSFSQYFPPFPSPNICLLFLLHIFNSLFHTKYLSILGHHYTILTCKRGTNRCVNSWQNRQKWPRQKFSVFNAKRGTTAGRGGRGGRD